ncbi:hypothetical protein [Micromonospora rubida]|uniref:hypothetical protein n=1 Tax=Micromonospora rubida TaxID=2697657 RepID=UPI0013766E70|nr:hypothetical protein [Micromonospora rubida]NBE81538.1 hypothetical protein [Micromonospora rubida]
MASAETEVNPDGTQEVASFTEGPFVAATDLAVKAARKLPQLAAIGFELRLLRVPARYLMALWLHSPAADLLVPLPPSPIGKEGEPVLPAVFFSDLAGLAATATPPP